MFVLTACHSPVPGDNQNQSVRLLHKAIDDDDLWVYHDDLRHVTCYMNARWGMSCVADTAINSPDNK